MHTDRIIAATAIIAPAILAGGCIEKVTPEERAARVAQLREMIRARALPEAPRGIIEHGFSMYRGPLGPLKNDPNISLSRVRIGELAVPSGRIVACDPGFVSGEAPFVREAPTGRFPVELTLAKLLKNDDERVALAAVLFSDAPVHRWEIAATTRTNPAKPLNCGFGVDSGMACYFDEQAAAAVVAFMQSDEGDDRLTQELKRSRGYTREWALLEVDASTHANIAVFSSGIGDGAYESCWALDTHDRPVALVTHFGLLGEDE
jgi:hypothetical protein